LRHHRGAVVVAVSPSNTPIIVLNAINSHLLRTQMCMAVQSPHTSMQAGTNLTMPYFLPNAAPSGCSDTNTAKKMATLVLRSCGSRPASSVKFALSAFPTFDRSSELARKKMERKGRRMKSNFLTTRAFSCLCSVILTGFCV